jgi:hypothetical protein
MGVSSMQVETDYVLNISFVNHPMVNTLPSEYFILSDVFNDGSTHEMR